MNLKETIEIMEREGLVIDRVLWKIKLSLEDGSAGDAEIQFKKEVESNGNRRKGSG